MHFFICLPKKIMNQLVMATPPTCLSLRFSGFFCEQRHCGRLGAYQKDMSWVLVKPCLVSDSVHQISSGVSRTLWSWHPKKNCGGQSKNPPYLVVDDFFHGKIRISCQTFRYQQSPPNSEWRKNGTGKHPFLVSEISVKSPTHPRHQGTFLHRFYANSFDSGPRVGPDGQQNLRIFGMLIVQNDRWWMIDDV